MAEPGPRCGSPKSERLLSVRLSSRLVGPWRSPVRSTGAKSERLLSVHLLDASGCGGARSEAQEPCPSVFFLSVCLLDASGRGGARSEVPEPKVRAPFVCPGEVLQCLLKKAQLSLALTKITFPAIKFTSPLYFSIPLTPHLHKFFLKTEQ